MDCKIELLRLLDKLNNHPHFKGKEVSFSYNYERKEKEYEYSTRGMEAMEKVEEDRAEGVLSFVLLDFDEEYVMNQEFIDYVVNKIDVVDEFNISFLLTDNTSADFRDVNNSTNEIKFIACGGHGLDEEFDFQFDYSGNLLLNDINKELDKIQNLTNILQEAINKLISTNKKS